MGKNQIPARRSYRKGGNMSHATLCDNAVSITSRPAIIHPQCRDAAATLRVTTSSRATGFRFNYRLCNECASLVEADARRCHYQFKSKKLRGKHTSTPEEFADAQARHAAAARAYIALCERELEVNTAILNKLKQLDACLASHDNHEPRATKGGK